MRRHQLLAELHQRLQPRSYLEIGVNNGASMTLSRTRSIGVDPFFQVKAEQQCDLHLVRTTSDEFFARPEPLAHFHDPHPDLVFIDGMHLAEYALRDYINVERHSHPGTVVVIDDMLPRESHVGSRQMHSGYWAGDVYKIAADIRRLRPDLVCIDVDTEPTGTMVVVGLDPSSRTLLDAYDDLVEAYVTPDPQDVPEAVLDRSFAVDARQLLDLDLWSQLVEMRAVETQPDEVSRAARRACDRLGVAARR